MQGNSSVCQRDGGAWAVDNEMRDVINRLYGNKNIVKLNNVVDKYYRRKKILCFLNWQHGLRAEAS